MFLVMRKELALSLEVNILPTLDNDILGRNINKAKKVIKIAGAI